MGTWTSICSSPCQGVPKTWAKESGKNVGKRYTNKKNRDINDINIVNNKNWDVSKQNWNIINKKEDMRSRNVEERWKKCGYID